MTETDIERLTRLAGNLPGVEVAPWYGTPGLKVGGKGFARVKSPACLMVLCPLGLKEALMEVEPHLYFETPHYHGWPGMLVHMDLIDDRRLQDRLECAWLERAPRKLVEDWARPAD